MNLKMAANYFTRTMVDGWNGTTWDLNVGQCALLPSDEFVSERPFGLRRKYLRMNPDTRLDPKYKLIRLGGALIFMRGDTQTNLQGEAYSDIVLVHQAVAQATLVSHVKVTAASGVTSSVTEQVVGQFYCDYENITSVTTRDFLNVRFGDALVYLPGDTPVNTNSILRIGPLSYEVEQVYQYMGLTYARCLASPT